MMTWQINWVKQISDDFLDENEFFKVRKKMERIALNPLQHTARIKNLPSNIRRIRMGSEMRMIVLMNNITKEITCLKYLPRKNCYSQKSMNKVLTIIKDISDN